VRERDTWDPNREGEREREVAMAWSKGYAWWRWWKKQGKHADEPVEARDGKDKDVLDGRGSPTQRTEKETSRGERKKKKDDRRRTSHAWKRRGRTQKKERIVG